MIKKNDPLVGAVQKIMQENALRYQVEQKLCEELGIYSKNALPNEHKANFDALLVQRINEALHPNQQKLDVHEPEKDKLTSQDFKMLRAKKKPQGADYAEQRRKARMADTGRMDEAEEGEETRETGAVTKDGKVVVPSTAMKAEPEKTGPSAADRSALTNKIKGMMKEAKEKKKEPSQKYMNALKVADKIQDGAEEPKKGSPSLRMAMMKRSDLQALISKEKKKVSESEISFDSVMEEIRAKLGEATMKEIEEEEEDPNKPYEDKPLSPGDNLDARQTADKMQSTPGGTPPVAAAKPMPAAAPTPAAAPAPAPAPSAGAAAPDNRSGLQKFFGIKATGRNAPAPTPGEAPKTVAQQAASGTAAASMRNAVTGIGQNSADRVNGNQNNIKPGEANAAAGQAAAPRPETGAGLSKVSNPNSPEVKAKVASVAANDAAREPIDVEKTINTAAKADAPAPLAGLDKPAAAPKPQSFGQAFAAARKAAGGAGGSFQYNGKTFQTNVKGGKYQAASKLKPVRESLQSTINNVLKG